MEQANRHGVAGGWLAGRAVSAERLRQIVEREGECVGKLRESSEWSPQWSASDCRAAAQDLSRVYTGTDGFMVPMVAQQEKNKRRAARRKSRSSKDKPRARRGVRRMRRGHRERYKEFTLGVFYSQDKRRKHVQATGGNPEALGRNLRRARLAVWTWLRRTRAPRKREALRRLRNYVGERTAMIRYPQSRSKGWDIGSGPTEALCKTTAARLKGSGMRWDPAGAQAMLHLTTLEDSNEWGAYWPLTSVHEN